MPIQPIAKGGWSRVISYLEERVELIQPSHLLIFLKPIVFPYQSIPPPLKSFSIQHATLLTAKQASTCRTMLGCVILSYRLMTCDQPPLAHCKRVSEHSYELTSPIF